MKSWSASIATSLIAIMAMTACGQQSKPAQEEADGGAAALRFEKATVELGEIGAGDVVSFSAVMTNSGTGLARIASIETDCACLAATSNPKAVGPGEATRLRLELDARGATGKLFHKVTVRTEAGDEAELMVTAEISETR